MALDRPPPPAFHRDRINTPVLTGTRAIGMLRPVCGQRIGIFAGSGVGKSTLLSMLAKGNRFDTAVFAAIGERGREVKEFVEDALAGGMGKAIVVVSTSDESPMMRLAAKTALATAEYFRDLGEQVLLIFDSITRYAQASREIALAAGEPPVSRGFPPSVFTELPKLLERAGCDAKGGSITGVFSVLVEGDDHNDPIADTIRGILDGQSCSTVQSRIRAASQPSISSAPFRGLPCVCGPRPSEQQSGTSRASSPNMRKPAISGSSAATSRATTRNSIKPCSLCRHFTCTSIKARRMSGQMRRSTVC